MVFKSVLGFFEKKEYSNVKILKLSEHTNDRIINDRFTFLYVILLTLKISVIEVHANVFKDPDHADNMI